MSDFEVRKDDLRQTRFSDGEPRRDEVADGEAQLEIVKFGFTANNISYGAIADLIGYWQFFPAADPAYGRIPVWGYGDVLASRAAGVEPGQRFYGYFPMSTHLTVKPDAGESGFVDATPHRAELPAVYNRYVRVEPGQPYEDATMILLPLFSTGWLIARVPEGRGSRHRLQRLEQDRLQHRVRPRGEGHSDDRTDLAPQPRLHDLARPLRRGHHLRRDCDRAQRPRRLRRLRGQPRHQPCRPRERRAHQEHPGRPHALGGRAAQRRPSGPTAGVLLRPRPHRTARRGAQSPRAARAHRRISVAARRAAGPVHGDRVRRRRRGCLPRVPGRDRRPAQGLRPARRVGEWVSGAAGAVARRDRTRCASRCRRSGNRRRSAARGGRASSRTRLARGC